MGAGRQDLQGLAIDGLHTVALELAGLLLYRTHFRTAAMALASLMLHCISVCLDSNVCSPLSLLQDLAIDAVQTVAVELGNGQREIDVKKYAKVEKIPGGALEDSRVLRGVMFNKDVVVPGRMRRWDVGLGWGLCVCSVCMSGLVWWRLGACTGGMFGRELFT